eukprot:501599_1
MSQSECDIDVNLVNLKTLSIDISLAALPPANSVTTATNYSAMIQHTKLRKLSVKNVDRNAEDTNNYLTYLFSIFIGITECECYSHSVSVIAWRNIFFTFIEDKRTYSLNTGHVLPPLQSLKFDNVTGSDHVTIVNSLLNLRITTLMNLEINVSRWSESIQLQLQRLFNFSSCITITVAN